jgi:hypothetical protein
LLLASRQYLAIQYHTYMYTYCMPLPLLLPPFCTDSTLSRSTTVAAGLDPRIDLSIPIAGSLPFEMRTANKGAPLTWRTCCYVALVHCLLAHTHTHSLSLSRARVLSHTNYLSLTHAHSLSLSQSGFVLSLIHTLFPHPCHWRDAD